MVKKYITTLKNGAREQKAFILGRSVTLRDGEVVSEGILTKTFPSLFEEIIEVNVTKNEAAGIDFSKGEVVSSSTEDELLVDESSDIVAEEISIQADESKPTEAKKVKTSRKAKS